MSISLRLGLVIVSLVLLIVVLMQLRKRRIPVKYSLVWMLSSLIILLIAIVPGLFVTIANYLGFVTMSNLVIAMFIFILLMISLTLTVIVSSQRKKITLLMQEVSMIKSGEK
ncbi:MAG: DUF2304 domain-containing protein [Bacilli bacterium]|nr:DUF2304 domain-containing protein [Bacilli bacterium]